jgi:hypothetical protein
VLQQYESIAHTARLHAEHHCPSAPPSVHALCEHAADEPLVHCDAEQSGSARPQLQSQY